MKQWINLMAAVAFGIALLAGAAQTGEAAEHHAPQIRHEEEHRDHHPEPPHEEPHKEHHEKHTEKPEPHDDGDTNITVVLDI